MSSVKRARFPGIDIVKITACLLVVTVHFFLNSGFYQISVTERGMHAALYVRWIALCSVPMFMIVTGFLMCQKTISGKYYCGILRVLILYIFLSCICAAFNGIFFHNNFSFRQFIRGFFTFTNARYGWYVEYYLSIFFIIPFLNAAFHALRTSHQFLLVATVCLFTIFASSFFIGFDPEQQFRLLPAYFSRCYPIAYYYLGAYIREHPPKRTLKAKGYQLLCFLLSLIFLVESCYRQSLSNLENHQVMRSYHFSDYGSYPVALCSTFLFLLLFDFPIPRRHFRVCKLLRVVSDATFAAYLLSEIFDDLGYTILFRKALTMQERFCVAPILIVGIFLCSMLSGILVQACYNWCQNRISKWIARLCLRRKKGRAW